MSTWRYRRSGSLPWAVKGKTRVTCLTFHTFYPLTDFQRLFLKWTLVLFVIDVEGWVDRHTNRGLEKNALDSHQADLAYISIIVWGEWSAPEVLEECGT